MKIVAIDLQRVLSYALSCAQYLSFIDWVLSTLFSYHFEKFCDKILISCLDKYQVNCFLNDIKVQVSWSLQAWASVLPNPAFDT